jgi:hypothetical protein
MKKDRKTSQIESPAPLQGGRGLRVDTDVYLIQTHAHSYTCRGA